MWSNECGCRTSASGAGKSRRWNEKNEEWFGGVDRFGDGWVIYTKSRGFFQFTWLTCRLGNLFFRAYRIAELARATVAPSILNPRKQALRTPFLFEFPRPRTLFHHSEAPRRPRSQINPSSERVTVCTVRIGFCITIFKTSESTQS